MKAQLKAWLNSQVGREPSFREACRNAGWDRRQALRGVEMAMALISIGLDRAVAANKS
jgi:ABC-type Fe3+ transport system permease subunit